MANNRGSAANLVRNRGRVTPLAYNRGAIFILCPFVTLSEAERSRMDLAHKITLVHV
jgi:hypothetical protein